MFTHRISAIAVVALLAVLPLGAQQASSRNVIVSGHGGGFTALANLDAAGSRDFRTGYAVGGGLGLQVSKYIVLRSDFTYARDEFRTNGVRTGEYLKRYYYGGAVQLQHPFAGGFTPYVLAGGGGVTLKQINLSSETKAQGTLGAGFSYAIPGSALSLFSEGRGYVYKPTDFGGSLVGVTKNQFDLAWTGGVSYRFHY
ncbi:MAG: outer membrane beta-barrel protein [Gemmatimonadetes bacterium]|nr:outer membrane beta-barrel protein [Gemmatimonadota bacterium]